jgi:hypothetical protein
MRTVYSHAACTIAATAAKNSDQGLFFRRDPWLVRPRHLTTTWDPTVHQNDEEQMKYPPAGEYWCDHDNFWMTSIEYAPLNKRGWVFQERHLSQRIMHFAANQLFWECYQCKASENYPNNLPSWAFSWHYGSERSDPTPLKTQIRRLRCRSRYNHTEPQDTCYVDSDLKSVEPTSEDLDDLYFEWGRWREEYSRSVVTKDEDRLVAMQGIAQDVAQLLGDQLVAGMWKNRILDELCFRAIQDSGNISSTKGIRPRKLQAPTWSWASTGQRIVLSEASRLRRQCIHLAQLSSLDVTTTEFGNPPSDILHIKCNLVRAVATWGVPSALEVEALTGELGDQPVSYLIGFTFTQTCIHLPCDIEDVDLDDWFVDKKDRSTDVYMLAIRHCPQEDEENQVVYEEMVEVLLLARKLVPEPVFERIGFFGIGGNGCCQLLNEHKASESQIITLV